MNDPDPDFLKSEPSPLDLNPDQSYPDHISYSFAHLSAVLWAISGFINAMITLIIETSVFLAFL